MLQGEKSPADACRTYKLHNSVLTRWTREFLERSHHVFEVPQQVTQETGKVAELERMVGQLTMQQENRKKGIKALERERKCELVKAMSQEYPVTALCQVFEINRSSFYYQAAEKSEDETTNMIVHLAAEHPTYGYRRITAMLHRQGQLVNNKRVLRLMRELNLVGKPPKKGCRTTNSNHAFKRHPNRVEGLAIERPDQVWVGDITYVRLGSEFVYLAVLLDVFTRSIRG